MDPSSHPDLPNPGACSPRRPGETSAAYHSRVRVHGWQRFIDDYISSTQSRLPSPHSDYEDEEVASTVRLYQHWIRIEKGEVDFWAYEYPVERAHRLGIPYCNYDTPGKSLSEIADEELSGASYEL